MCKFCGEIESIKESHKHAASWATDSELEQYGKYMQELTVAIVERNWYQKHGKKHSSRAVHFRYRGLGFKLKYCPECGRKL